MPLNYMSSVDRMWVGAKIVEAKKPLRVFLLGCDIEGAESGNPTNCAFARAVRRACGCQRAVFLRRTAYVELMQGDGQRVIERFMMPPEMRALIEEFDKTGKAPEGGFVLVPPRRCETLEAKKERERKSKEAMIKGTAKVRAGTPRAGTSLPVDQISVHGVRQRGGVRYGSGMVHFPVVKDESALS